MFERVFWPLGAFLICANLIILNYRAELIRDAGKAAVAPFAFFKGILNSSQSFGSLFSYRHADFNDGVATSFVWSARVLLVVVNVIGIYLMVCAR
jgi:hypothetical protein